MTFWKYLSFPVLIAGLMAGPASAQGISEKDLLPVEEAFQLEAKAVSRSLIEFRFRVAPGYYLYRDRTQVKAVSAGFKTNPLDFPPGEVKDDPNFGRMVVYHRDFTAKLTGAAADDASAITFEVRYQGCADIGICYPPQKTLLEVDLPADANVAIATSSSSYSKLESIPGNEATSSNGNFLDLNQAPPLLGGMVNGDTNGNNFSGNGVDALPLPPEQAFVFEAIATTPTEILARFTMPKGYYLYRDHTQFILADSGALGVPRWPAAQTVDDPEFGLVPVFFDQVEVPVALSRSSGAETRIDLIAKFQGCEADGICYPPMTRSISLDLSSASVDELAAAAARVEAEWLSAPPAAASVVGQQATDDTPAAGISLWKALLLALAGGLILNLMPCVLPVLSLKALSLAQSSETPEHAHQHALWYTLGVICSFAAIGMLVLGLRVGGQALGWGFQLQQPLVVAVMAYVMVVLGLGLSGLITLGAGLSNLGSGLAAQSGRRGDFFTGVLACVVASPCTTPFMGGALAFAFAQPAWVALLVFITLGFGLALPFLLIGFIPGLAHRLPKPGAWMETLKQILAFPLYLTAAWLAWVLGKQRGVDAMALWLVGAIALSAALWWWERGRYRNNAISRWVISTLMVIASLAALWSIQYLLVSSLVAVHTDSINSAYSAERLADLRARNQPVFVNMTADWCLSCKLNERSTLGTDRFSALLRNTGTVYLKGDWTNEDPAITAFLKEHHAVGVPLYVYFPRNGGEVKKLPSILTPEIVERALQSDPL